MKWTGLGKSECHFVMKWIEVEITIDVRQKESRLLPTKVVLTSNAGTLLRKLPTNGFI